MIVELLKKYLAFTETQVNEYFTITETPTEYIVKAKKWLDGSTFGGARKLITEHGGGYEQIKEKGEERAVFHIPKTKTQQAPIREGSEGIAPECVNIDNGTPYKLDQSMRGIGQLCPVLVDAHGNIIDGFHRKEIDKHWPEMKLDHIQNTVQLEIARLATNFCRRTMTEEEKQQKIGFLVGAGLKPEEIAEKTGIHRTTVYRYIPANLKDQTKSEAIKQGIQKVEHVAAATSIVRQPTPEPEGTHARINHTGLTECESCHLGTDHPQPFGKFNNLCEKCFERACRNPTEFKRPAPEAKVKEPAKPKESWEHRAAVMKPQHSKMEERLLIRLKNAGYSLETDREFCVQSTKPDFYDPKREIAIYVDGPVHQGREDRDEQLRELLTRRHNVRVLTVQYEKDSDEDGLFGEINGMLEEKP